jgi:quercetin dioxygenase-like cupin family protein
VTDGILTVRIGEETVVVPTESVVRIPPGVPHTVRNEGRVEVRTLAGAPWNRATFFTELYGGDHLSSVPFAKSCY